MKKNWLLAYNFIQSLGWAVTMVWLLSQGKQPGLTGMILLTVFQGLAVLEILHVVVGWVKSPLFTTAIQVGSRIFILLLLNLLYFYFPEEFFNFPGLMGLHLVTIAWGITEVVRYAYYFQGLRGQEIRPLTWLRYTLFLILYPMGVTGEWFVMAAVAKVNDYQWVFPNVILLLIAVGYLIFFPKMYGHMLSQRRKKL